MFTSLIIGSTFFLGTNRDNIRQVINTGQRQYEEDDFVKIPQNNNNNNNGDNN
jgi:hypothetical protein